MNKLENIKLTESQYDLDFLKDKLKELNNNKNLLIDPDHCSLQNLQIIQMPNKNKACPCGSGSKYKKCCEIKDLKLRVSIIEQIE